jgi:hypothetical protein
MALADLKKHELVAVCMEWGLDATGTKAEMIALLEADDREVEDDYRPAEVHVELELANEIIPDPDMSGFDMEMEGDDAFINALHLHVHKRDPTMGELTHYRLMLGILTRDRVLRDLVRSEEYRLANCA